MDNHFDNFTLLTDGAGAFPEILSCIEQAQKSIYINMFIWRDDYIGNEIAKAVLNAAHRGVKVYLSVDRVGGVLEYAEEYRASFFHKKLTVTDRVKSTAVRLLYPELWTKRRAVDINNALYKAVVSHPNITASVDISKADHSKYYIFDDEIVIMGGINIEDKEHGSDISGRVYQDYMVKIVGAQYVNALKSALSGSKNTDNEYGFCVNSKDCSPRCFEIEQHYLDIIDKANKELIIVMAYFAPPKHFLTAIANAYRRGVDITIMLPKRSNLMNSASLRASKQLMKITCNGVNLYLSPKMVHTKFIANEKLISFGSANMMKNAFTDLSELNFYINHADHPFCNEIIDSVKQNITLSEHIESSDRILYSPVKAWLEGFI